MSVWNVSDGAKYFSCESSRWQFFRCPANVAILVFISFTVLATAPPIFSWLSDLCPHDAEQRAFILGWAIALYYAVCECHRASLSRRHQLPFITHSVMESSIDLAGQRSSSLQSRLESIYRAVDLGDHPSLRLTIHGVKDLEVSSLDF